MKLLWSTSANIMRSPQAGRSGAFTPEAAGQESLSSLAAIVPSDSAGGKQSLYLIYPLMPPLPWSARPLGVPACAHLRSQVLVKGCVLANLAAGEGFCVERGECAFVQDAGRFRKATSRRASGLAFSRLIRTCLSRTRALSAPSRTTSAGCARGHTYRLHRSFTGGR